MIVLPVYNNIIVPEANIYMQSDQFRKQACRDPKTGENVIFLILQQNKDREDIIEEDFYPIGVSGTITEVNSNGYLIIHTAGRVHIDEIMINQNRNIELTVSRLSDIQDDDPQSKEEHLNQLKNALLKFSEGFQWGPMARPYIRALKSVNEAAAMMSAWMTNTAEDKYALLEESSCAARRSKMEQMIYEYLEMTQVSKDAHTAAEQDYQKAYKKAAIKKQMEYLQKELDEMDPDSVSDVRRYELKIQDSGMNEEARQEAEKALSRLKQEGPNSPESGMLYSYLDFITGLPWKKEDWKYIDLGQAEKILDEEHFGLKKVKKRIIQQIAVMNLMEKQSGSILCFVGAPGTGKTSIGKSIARALNREYIRISLGGVRDEADIRGHRRTYIGAMPGRIMDGIQKAGVSNPVMVLDEVDKLSGSYNGDPASALLEVLDPEQNSTFTDHYLNVPYDLSDVLFICTANTLDTIPEPLLNRMEIIEFSGYTASDKFQIARKYLIPDAMSGMGIKDEQLQIKDEAIRTIISDYTMEAGVRGLKKRIDDICRNAAVNIIKEENHTEIIDEHLVREYIDLRPIQHDHVLQKKKPGIVTGLAWTRAGGEILFIETLFTKGSGKTIITGQLGDVMKESAEIAVSLVKAMFPEKADMFAENDLHIHVPEGAVPKDGPSAGITLTTALASLVTGHPVDPEYAMTGEVSLRGSVTPIGGLPEKLMAAQCAGVKTVFIPADNEYDLKDVDEEVKDQLIIIPVHTVSDVLHQTGIISAESQLPRAV